MNWLISINDLDSQQRDFLKNIVDESNNEQIIGFPGSGKTILMLYAAKIVRDTIPDAKIIYVEFTHALINMLEVAVKELNYVGKETDPIKIVTYIEYMNSYCNIQYDYVFCDEVQDMPTQLIQAMKNGSNRVIIAGDANQSIYKEDPKYHQKPIKEEEIANILSPNKLPLNIIHRLSKNIMNAINSFMPGMNIMSGRIPMIRQNVQIRLWKAPNKSREVHYIFEDALETMNINDSVAILLPTHRSICYFSHEVLRDCNKQDWEEVSNRYGKPDFGAMNNHFENIGIPLQYVANGYGDLSKKKIIITTYHSVKGLDFDKVFIPFCGDYEHFPGGEEWTSEDDKKLFMVALTRSRRDLIISYTNRINSYVSTFADKCLYKEWEKTPNLFDNLPKEEKEQTVNKKDDFEFDF